jgi:hypothetical protein
VTGSNSVAKYDKSLFRVSVSSLSVADRGGGTTHVVKPNRELQPAKISTKENMTMFRKWGGRDTDLKNREK